MYVLFYVLLHTYIYIYYVTTINEEGGHEFERQQGEVMGGFEGGKREGGMM